VAAGDFSIAAGSQRVLTIAAQAGITILHSGTALHVALTLAAGTTLRYVTTCTSQALTAGGTVDVPAWTITMAGPT
jgi:environmental stress-induced protein Ves